MGVEKDYMMTFDDVPQAAKRLAYQASKDLRLKEIEALRLVKIQSDKIVIYSLLLGILIASAHTLDRNYSVELWWPILLLLGFAYSGIKIYQLQQARVINAEKASTTAWTALCPEIKS
jgi:hypothetical protein